MSGRSLPTESRRAIAEATEGVTSAVRITAKIGKNGEVLAASPSGGGTLSPTVISCVASRVSSAQFSPPEGGSATLVIPVSMTSE